MYFHLSVKCAVLSQLKAALMSNFILTVGQITMCNIKEVTYSDKPTENYSHPTLQFPTDLHRAF